LELTRHPVTSGINNTTVVVIAVALFASFTDAVATDCGLSSQARLIDRIKNPVGFTKRSCVVLLNRTLRKYYFSALQDGSHDEVVDVTGTRTIIRLTIVRKANVVTEFVSNDDSGI
jgi:hypothetical protein